MTLLDFKIGITPDPNELVRAVINWHFNSKTGTPFWLNKAKVLDFDPLVDIKNYDDLRLFPNVATELRTVPISDLIPRGYGQQPYIAGIYESGGTTGLPKRVICMRDWLDHMICRSNLNLKLHGFVPHLNWLGLTPTGPHFVGKLFIESVKTYGKHAFIIDMDPRWVKKLIAAGKADEANAYAEHLIDQAIILLKTQNIGVLTLTPPLLDRLVCRPEAVDLVKKKIKAIRWGGTQMDLASRKRYKTQIFPNIPLYGHYGNTMILGIAGERIGLGLTDPCIFDSLSPYISFSVIDSTKNQPVAYGERGQVITHHLSKAWFLPNNLERDLATRIKSQGNQLGDSLADIRPVAVFEHEPVIEGVY